MHKHSDTALASPFLATPELAAQVPSPTLLIDRARVRHNIARMRTHIGDLARLRPHVKTHKCTEIFKLQLEAGITKAKTATLAEVDMVVRAGGHDVVLAYPLVGPHIEHAVTFARTHPQVTFAALTDDLEIVRQINAEAARQGITFSLYVDLNPGMDRTGIALGAPAARLARAIHQAPHLHLSGLHMYDGHILGDFETALSAMQSPYAALHRLIADLRQSGCPVENVITAGSPAFLPAAKHFDFINEVSPGTWIFWDTAYSDMMPELFDIALCVLGRVISRPTPDIMTLDTGSKAVSVDAGKPNCRLLGFADAEVLGWSEEHLRVRLPAAHQDVRPGKVFYLVPRHVCTTVALYDEALIVENGEIVDCWRIEARGRPSLRPAFGRQQGTQET
jgi:D-serine deaminase-like pyridoxal phosphate-dependent protein